MARDRRRGQQNPDDDMQTDSRQEIPEHEAIARHHFMQQRANNIQYHHYAAMMNAAQQDAYHSPLPYMFNPRNANPQAGTIANTQMNFQAHPPFLIHNIDMYNPRMISPTFDATRLPNGNVPIAGNFPYPFWLMPPPPIQPRVTEESPQQNFTRQESHMQQRMPLVNKSNPFSTSISQHQAREAKQQLESRSSAFPSFPPVVGHQREQPSASTYQGILDNNHPRYRVNMMPETINSNDIRLKRTSTSQNNGHGKRPSEAHNISKAQKNNSKIANKESPVTNSIEHEPDMPTRQEQMSVVHESSPLSAIHSQQHTGGVNHGQLDRRFMPFPIMPFSYGYHREPHSANAYLRTPDLFQNSHLIQPCDALDRQSKQIPPSRNENPAEMSSNVAHKTHSSTAQKENKKNKDQSPETSSVREKPNMPIAQPTIPSTSTSQQHTNGLNEQYDIVEHLAECYRQLCNAYAYQRTPDTSHYNHLVHFTNLTREANGRQPKQTPLSPNENPGEFSSNPAHKTDLSMSQKRNKKDKEQSSISLNKNPGEFSSNPAHKTDLSTSQKKNKKDEEQSHATNSLRQRPNKPITELTPRSTSNSQQNACEVNEQLDRMHMACPPDYHRKLQTTNVYSRTAGTSHYNHLVHLTNKTQEEHERQSKQTLPSRNENQNEFYEANAHHNADSTAYKNSRETKEHSSVAKPFRKEHSVSIAHQPMLSSTNAPQQSASGVSEQLDSLSMANTPRHDREFQSAHIRPNSSIVDTASNNYLHNQMKMMREMANGHEIHVNRNSPALQNCQEKPSPTTNVSTSKQSKTTETITETRNSHKNVNKSTMVCQDPLKTCPSGMSMAAPLLPPVVEYPRELQSAAAYPTMFGTSHYDYLHHYKNLIPHTPNVEKDTERTPLSRSEDEELCSTKAEHGIDLSMAQNLNESSEIITEEQTSHENVNRSNLAHRNPPKSCLKDKPIEDTQEVLNSNSQLKTRAGLQENVQMHTFPLQNIDLNTLGNTSGTTSYLTRLPNGNDHVVENFLYPHTFPIPPQPNAREEIHNFIRQGSNNHIVKQPKPLLNESHSELTSTSQQRARRASGINGQSKKTSTELSPHEEITQHHSNLDSTDEYPELPDSFQYDPRPWNKLHKETNAQEKLLKRALPQGNNDHEHFFSAKEYPIDSLIAQKHKIVENNKESLVNSNALVNASIMQLIDKSKSASNTKQNACGVSDHSAEVSEEDRREPQCASAYTKISHSSHQNHNVDEPTFVGKDLPQACLSSHSYGTKRHFMDAFSHTGSSFTQNHPSQDFRSHLQSVRSIVNNLNDANYKALGGKSDPCERDDMNRLHWSEQSSNNSRSIFTPDPSVSDSETNSEVFYHATDNKITYNKMYDTKQKQTCDRNHGTPRSTYSNNNESYRRGAALDTPAKASKRLSHSHSPSKEKDEALLHNTSDDLKYNDVQETADNHSPNITVDSDAQRDHGGPLTNLIEVSSIPETENGNSPQTESPTGSRPSTPDAALSLSPQATENDSQSSASVDTPSSPPSRASSPYARSEEGKDTKLDTESAERDKVNETSTLLSHYLEHVKIDEKESCSELSHAPNDNKIKSPFDNCGPERGSYHTAEHTFCFDKDGRLKPQNLNKRMLEKYDKHAASERTEHSGKKRRKIDPNLLVQHTHLSGESVSSIPETENGSSPQTKSSTSSRPSTPDAALSLSPQANESDPQSSASVDTLPSPPSRASSPYARSEEGKDTKLDTESAERVQHTHQTGESASASISSEKAMLTKSSDKILQNAKLTIPKRQLWSHKAQLSLGVDAEANLVNDTQIKIDKLKDSITNFGQAFSVENLAHQSIEDGGEGNYYYYLSVITNRRESGENKTQESCSLNTDTTAGEQRTSSNSLAHSPESQQSEPPLLMKISPLKRPNSSSGARIHGIDSQRSPDDYGSPPVLDRQVSPEVGGVDKDRHIDYSSGHHTEFPNLIRTTRASPTDTRPPLSELRFNPNIAACAAANITYKTRSIEALSDAPESTLCERQNATHSRKRNKHGQSTTGDSQSANRVSELTDESTPKRPKITFNHKRQEGKCQLVVESQHQFRQRITGEKSPYPNSRPDILLNSACSSSTSTSHKHIKSLSQNQGVVIPETSFRSEDKKTEEFLEGNREIIILPLKKRYLKKWQDECATDERTELDSTSSGPDQMASPLLLTNPEDQRLLHFSNTVEDGRDVLVDVPDPNATRSNSNPKTNNLAPYLTENLIEAEKTASFQLSISSEDQGWLHSFNNKKEQKVSCSDMPSPTATSSNSNNLTSPLSAGESTSHVQSDDLPFFQFYGERSSEEMEDDSMGRLVIIENSIESASDSQNETDN